MTEVVDSYNFFINSDRNHGEDTQGDQTRLNLGLQPIVCGEGEFIRLSLHMFAMRRSWTDINETNSKFVLWYTPPNAGVSVVREPYPLNLPHINTSSGINSLYDAIASTVTQAFKAVGLHTTFSLKYQTYASFKSSPDFSENVEVKYGGRLIFFIVDERAKVSSFQRPSKETLPAIQCNVSDGDSYILFGGARCHLAEKDKPADSNNGIAHVAPYYQFTNSPDIIWHFPYNYSRRTQKMAYITTVSYTHLTLPTIYSV